MSREPLLVAVWTVDLIWTADIAATTIPFLARERFVVNAYSDAPVKIAYVDPNFREWFFDKKEEPFSGSILKCAKLSRRSVVSHIIAEVGGHDKAETTLTELFALMVAKREGKSGPLATDGSNIFFIKDVNGKFRSVNVFWRSGREPWREQEEIGDFWASIGSGWCVYAHQLPSAAWECGCKVFFRNSS